jgi:hypothetical protein
LVLVLGQLELVKVSLVLMLEMGLLGEARALPLVWELESERDLVEVWAPLWELELEQDLVEVWTPLWELELEQDLVEVWAPLWELELEQDLVEVRTRHYT